jgi:DNA-binding transcriptional regulator PaaX
VTEPLTEKPMVRKPTRSELVALGQIHDGCFTIGYGPGNASRRRMLRRMIGAGWLEVTTAPYQLSDAGRALAKKSP